MMPLKKQKNKTLNKLSPKCTCTPAILDILQPSPPWCPAAEPEMETKACHMGPV